MKKLNYLLLGAAGLLMASCANDDLSAPGSEREGNYHVTVKLPADMATRADEKNPFGAGYEATVLHYALYDADNGQLFVYEDVENFPSNALETTVDFNLVSGKSYYIVFFAQSQTSEDNQAYKFNAPEKYFTVNYDAMADTYNQDYYDCFYQVYETGVIGNNAQDETITLYRPVAQVNWGTNDLDDPTVTDQGAYGEDAKFLVSQVKTTAYDMFDFFGTNEAGEMVGNVYASSVDDVTLNYLPRPAASEVFPVEDYDYVSMQYLLVPRDQELINLTMTVSNQGYGDNLNPNKVTTDDIEVTNAPVQANYRTNIYGTLLTDKYQYTVVKDPNWFKPDYDINLGVWDGSTATTPQKNSAGNYYIDRASDLAGLAAMVNGGDDLAGETVELASDFDMGGNSLSIGSATRTSGNADGNAFRGTFEGNGHVISNLTIEGTTTADDAAGFIPNLDGAGKLQNVTFENIVINAPNNEQAGVVGIVTNGATISNVAVTSGKVTSKQAAGGIAGRILKSGTIENCANAATINASAYNAGGIVGAAYYTQTGTTMVISKCTNNGTITSGTSVGGIVGLSCAEVTGCRNNGKVNGTASSVGGVVGEQNTAGFVKDCVNTANVQITNFASTAYATGGIVGWVRYNDISTNYQRQNSIEVTGCTNYASVSGNTGVGGIVGTWYMCGNCEGNFNYAPSLVAANTFVAGIVGDSQWTGTQPTGFTPNDLLTVNNNQTSTTLAQMKGGNATLYVYINNSQKTTQSGNDVVEPQTAPEN